MNSEPAEAMQGFETVIQFEESHNNQKHSFNAMKFIILLTLKLGHYDKSISRTENLLKISSSVSKNEFTDAINSILDCMHRNLTD